MVRGGLKWCEAVKEEMGEGMSQEVRRILMEVVFLPIRLVIKITIRKFAVLKVARVAKW